MEFESVIDVIGALGRSIDSSVTDDVTGDVWRMLMVSPLKKRYTRVNPYITYGITFLYIKRDIFGKKINGLFILVPYIVQETY